MSSRCWARKPSVPNASAYRIGDRSSSVLLLAACEAPSRELWELAGSSWPPSGTKRQLLSAVDSVADGSCLCFPLCRLLKNPLELSRLLAAGILALCEVDDIVSSRRTCPAHRTAQIQHPSKAAASLYTAGPLHIVAVGHKCWVLEVYLLGA